MALKRQHRMTAEFSMASMTDVIFLLLIFFMVTSSFVFPSALQVDLPQSSEQSAIKPGTKVFLKEDLSLYTSFGDEEPQLITEDDLPIFLLTAQQQEPESYIALYADENVSYGNVVRIINLAASHNLKMVLATKPMSTQDNQ